MNDKCTICDKGFIECMEEDSYPEDHFHTFDASDANLGFDSISEAAKLLGMTDKEMHNLLEIGF